MRAPELPSLDVSWDELEDAAADVALRARVTADYLADAATAWNRFRSFYREPDTQDRVYTALDDLKEPAEDWWASLHVAAEVISAFADAGRALARRRQELAGLLRQQDSLPETEQGQDDGADHQLHGQAAALARDWADLQETTAAALRGIGYGNGAGLPLGAVARGSALPEVGWAALTSRLDDRFGTLATGQLLRSLRGLNEVELRDWSAANPEAAALLAGRKLIGLGASEALMRVAMADGAHLTENGVGGIRDAWLSLSPAEQERLLLLYPAVFGSLNGVPFAQRAKANLITVPGFRQTLGAELDAMKEPRSADYSPDRGGGGAWKSDHEDWSRQRQPLERKLRGLDYALKENSQVVMVGIEGDGQIVTMVGTPSADTRVMGTLIPGMDVDLGELEANSNRLAVITGVPAAGTVSFYWQGTDIPQNVLDSASPQHNEMAGPRLAAFDYAVDLEIPSGARTTYVAYSAGAPLLGTGEREGLDSSNIVYVAPAGPGHEVSGPEDTANAEAIRYWIQTRSDYLIEIAQGVGGSVHGGSMLEGGGVGRMGVTRLESGFLVHRDATTLMGGHSDYFSRVSTAALNMLGVIRGTQVILFVEDEYLATADGPMPFSPLEAWPERYANDRFETVKIRVLDR